MILDEKGKLFGKVSIVDIVFIILVLLLFGGIYVKFFNVKNTQQALTETIEFSVFIQNVRQPTVDAIMVGENAFEESTGLYLGEIIDKEVKPSEDKIIKADGDIVIASMPGKYDIIVTFKVPGIEKEDGYFANGNKEIKHGSDLKVETKLIAFESKINSVEVVE